MVDFNAMFGSVLLKELILLSNIQEECISKKTRQALEESHAAIEDLNKLVGCFDKLKELGLVSSEGINIWLARGALELLQEKQ